MPPPASPVRIKVSISLSSSCLDSSPYSRAGAVMSSTGSIQRHSKSPEVGGVDAVGADQALDVAVLGKQETAEPGLISQKLNWATVKKPATKMPGALLISSRLAGIAEAPEIRKEEQQHEYQRGQLERSGRGCAG